MAVTASWLVPAIVASLFSMVVLTGVYVYLYRLYRQQFMFCWSIGWGINAIRYIFELGNLMVLPGLFLSTAVSFSAILGSLFLLTGVYTLVGKKPPTRFNILGGIALVGTVLSTALKLPFYVNALFGFVLLGLVSLWVGVFLLRSYPLKTFEVKLAGWILILWGLHRLDYPFLRSVEWFAPWGFLLTSIFGLVLAFSFIAIYFRRTLLDKLAVEEELRASVEKQATIVKNLPSGLVYQEGDRLVINQAVERITGYSQAELNTLDRWFETLYPGQAEEVRRLYQADVESGFLYVRTVTITRKDGSQRLVDFTGGTLAGNPYWMMVDITEKVKAGQVYETILRTALDGIWLVDEDGQLVDVNDSACRMLGYTRDELIGIHITQIDAQLTGEQVRQRLDQVFSTGELRLESEHRCKDGRLIYVDIQAKTLPSDRDLLFVFVRDITESKLSERMLRESEQQYRLLAENIKDVIWRLDLSTLRFIYISPSIIQLRGLTVEEAMQETLDQAICPEDVETIQKELPIRLQRFYEGEDSIQTMTHTIRQPHKNGTLVDVEIITTLLTDASGRVVEILGVSRDVTERVQTHQELRESEERYRSIFDKSSSAMLLLDPETGDIVDANQAAVRFYGYPYEELARKPVREINLSDPARINVEMKRARERERDHFYFQHRLASGEIRDVEVFSGPINLRGRRLLFSIIHDITDRRRTETALRESEERFRLAFDDSPEGMVMSSLDGFYLRVNRAFCEMTGYREEELIGANFRNISHPDDLDENETQVRQLLEGKGKSFDLDKRYVGKKGNIIWVSLRTYLIRDAQEVPSYFVVHVRDITQRKISEEQLRLRLKEMEAVSRISTALNSAENLDSMLPVLLDETLNVFDLNNGAILMVDPDTHAIQHMVTRGWMDQIPETLEDSGTETLLETVVNRARLFHTAETGDSVSGFDPGWKFIPRGWNGVIMPVRAVNQVFGVLAVSYPAEHPFGEPEINLLNTIAEFAGNAFHRTRLHEQTLLSLNRINALHDIDTTITSNLDLRTTLKLILDIVTGQLSLDAADFLEYNPVLQQLKYITGSGFNSSLVESRVVRLGDGLAGKAALERREKVSQDLRKQNTQHPLFYQQEGFVFGCALPLISQGKVTGVLEVFKRSELQPSNDWFEFLDTLAGQAAIALERLSLIDSLRQSNEELLKAYNDTLESLSLAMDLRDKDTEKHTQRVRVYTEKLARRLGMSEDEILQVRRGAALHDIGKLGVPDRILNKPGALTDEEWVIMRQHPDLAYAMLSPIEYLRPALDIPYCHHERWDGSGYPRGLRGEQIPLAARIFAVIDVWDALTHDRPYRKAWDEKDALAYIEENAGVLLDPNVVKVFLQMRQEESQVDEENSSIQNLTR